MFDKHNVIPVARLKWHLKTVVLYLAVCLLLSHPVVSSMCWYNCIFFKSSHVFIIHLLCCYICVVILNYRCVNVLPLTIVCSRMVWERRFHHTASSILLSSHWNMKKGLLCTCYQLSLFTGLAEPPLLWGSATQM